MFKGLSIRCFSMFASFFLLYPLASIAESTPADSQTRLAGFSVFLAKYHPIFTLTGGASIASLASSASFAPLDLCSYNYSPDNSYTTSLLLGAFIGTEILHSANWALSAGLGYYQPAPSSNTGTLVQGPDSVSSDIYRYNYNVKSQQLLVEGKFLWIVRDTYMPYLSLGLGAARNETYGYQTTVPYFYEFTPAYANQTQTNFSYAVGAGVDFVLNPAVRFGLGYRFSDLGRANLGAGQIDGIPISNTLKQSHLYANQIVAQLTLIPW